MCIYIYIFTQINSTPKTAGTPNIADNTYHEVANPGTPGLL